jgi:hypothetical protein
MTSVEQIERGTELANASVWVRRAKLHLGDQYFLLHEAAGLVAYTPSLFMIRANLARAIAFLSIAEINIEQELRELRNFELAGVCE